MESYERIKKVERRMMLVGIIETPGAIMVALGLYGKFGANGEPFLSFLEHEIILNGMLGGGILIMSWGGLQVTKLSREKERLLRETAL